jgi:prepilin-type N-terminal cleavage/methylation domain-containing protein
VKKKMKKIRDTKAFTLIELLVVIAIIALLLAILIPSLRKAKLAAQRAVCVSHLHQFAVALEMYEMQYDHKRFAVRNNSSDTNLYWMGKLADFLGNAEYGKKFRLGETIDVMSCPSAPASKFVSNTTRKNPSGQWGTNDRPWEWARANDMSTIGSITINGWVVYDWMYDETAGIKEFVFRGWDNVRPEVPVFGDGLWTIGWPKASDLVPPDLAGEDTSSLDTWQTHMWRFCIARHSRMVNIMFKDLHSEVVRLEELWRLPWHKDYVYPTQEIQLPSH